MASPSTSSMIVRSLIPARMDRLPWTRFHTRLVMALGTAWVLDGLEITLASSVAGVLTRPNTLHMSSAAVGAIATVYLVVEVVAALEATETVTDTDTLFADPRVSVLAVGLDGSG